MWWHMKLGTGWFTWWWNDKLLNNGLWWLVSCLIVVYESQKSWNESMPGSLWLITTIIDNEWLCFENYDEPLQWDMAGLPCEICICFDLVVPIAWRQRFFLDWLINNLWFCSNGIISWKVLSWSGLCFSSSSCQLTTNMNHVLQGKHGIFYG